MSDSDRDSVYRKFRVTVFEIELVPVNYPLRQPHFPETIDCEVVVDIVKGSLNVHRDAYAVLVAEGGGFNVVHCIGESCFAGMTWPKGMLIFA